MSGREREIVGQAFDSNYIAPLGPMVDAFERDFSEYTGIKHCVALSSGTAAMHLALRYLGVGPGDEVLAASFTFIGSVSPVIFLGATPVFIDSDLESWNMDPGLLEAELERCGSYGKLPKAVIPTDLYGQCCNYERIYKICERFNVPVVVDAAEAMGGRYLPQGIKHGASVHAGTGARAAVYSFNGNKIMTTSGGGMLASDDRNLIEKARFWSQQAREPFAHYEHVEIGHNYRMSNILAAIGRGQLQVLDDRIKRKRELFQVYVDRLNNVPGLSFMPEPDWSRCNRWLTVVLIDADVFGACPETVRLALEAENIESRPVWKPMHLQPVFKGTPMRGGVVSEDLFNRGLCLPSGTAMVEADLERIVSIIRSCGKV
jgi:dTDP-4-amino-4,6-dideoxygalactose transaminase